MEKCEEYISNRFYEMSHFYEGILTKEEEANCIGLVLFKPDSVATALDLPIRDYIQQELEKATGKPTTLFAFTQLCLDREMVEQLYPKQRADTYFQDIEDHLTSGPVSLVLVVSKDAPQELNKLKGSVRIGSGIRGKFTLNYSLDERFPMKGEPDESRAKSVHTNFYVANLLHVPDSREDTKTGIELLLPKKDLADLINTVPLFARWYQQEAK